jgi:hypothetical protein
MIGAGSHSLLENYPEMANLIVALLAVAVPCLALLWHFGVGRLLVPIHLAAMVLLMSTPFLLFFLVDRGVPPEESYPGDGMVLLPLLSVLSIEVPLYLIVLLAFTIKYFTNRFYANKAR